MDVFGLCTLWLHDVFVTDHDTADKCTIYHLRLLQNERNKGIKITKTPTGNGREVAFVTVLEKNISWAIKQGIEGSYQVKIALDSANMTAGTLV